MNKESIRNIAESIRRQVKRDRGLAVCARARCTISTNTRYGVEDKIFWLTNNPPRPSSFKINNDGGNIHISETNPIIKGADEEFIYKNSKAGGYITKYKSGQYNYTVVIDRFRKVENTLNIHNRAIYSHNTKDEYDPIDVEICIDGDENVYRFQRLSDLFKELDRHSEDIRKQAEALEQLRIEQERIAKELAEQKEREELERLEAERLRKEEESRQRQLEIERLEKLSRDAENEIEVIQSFMRRNVELRSQHLLDPYQEDAKRSHLFDGVPIVIDGGPGTGKTTTMIQRLKFLISREALEDYEDEGSATNIRGRFVGQPKIVQIL